MPFSNSKFQLISIILSLLFSLFINSTRGDWQKNAHLQELVVNDIEDMQDSMDKVNNKVVNRLVNKLAQNGLYVTFANLDSTIFGKHDGNTTETPWYRIPRRRVDDCPICFEAIDSGNAAMRCVGDAGRHHYFHARCLQQWILQNVRGARCPTCRGHLQLNAHRLRQWLNSRNAAGLNQQELSVLASIEGEFVPEPARASRWSGPAAPDQGATDFTEMTFLIPRLIHRVVCLIAFLLFFWPAAHR